MNLLIALFLIILKAVSDGLAIADHKAIAGIIDIIWQGGIVCGLYAWTTGVRRFDYDRRFIKTIIGFIFLRFAIFDVTWNISAGQSLSYIGGTKVYDWVLAWLVSNIGEGIWLIRFILGFWGVAWLTKWGNK